jgi:hypothetical protein
VIKDLRLSANDADEMMPRRPVMSGRTTATLATFTLLATTSLAGTVWSASPATAALVTHCVGTGGAVTVPNDLLVPTGESCSLEGTKITGNVSVAAGANLVIADGTVSGEIQIASDGYLDAVGTSIGGQVTLAAGGYGAFLKSTESGPVTVQPKGSAGTDGFFFAENTTVDGNVQAGAGEVRLDRTSQVTGNVSTSGTYYTDVHDSFVDGTLSVLNNATGSVVCGSAVRGKSTFSGNLGGVQLGPNGSLDGCAAGGYWGRDVTISNTSGGVTVDGNIIDGRLSTTNNTPVAKVAADNRVRGGIVGEQTTKVVANKSLKANRAAAARDDRTEVDAEHRRSAAVTSAEVAGDAGL